MEISTSCKNCNTALQTEANYCFWCGAKVIRERITLKYLLSGFLLTLGWDNGFWKTFWHLLIQPQVVFERYLSGTRKMYTAPLTFFAITVTLSVLAISFYTDELVEISTNGPLVESTIHRDSGSDNAKQENINEQETKTIATNLERQLFFEKFAGFLYKYYYYFNFLFLPFYAFIAYLVFGKPNNFAEHLVINAYISGPVGIFGFLVLPLSSIPGMSWIFYYGQFIIIFIFYIYAYQKYRRYSLKKLLSKILRFFIVIMTGFLAIAILGVLIGILSKIISG